MKEKKKKKKTVVTEITVHSIGLYVRIVAQIPWQCIPERWACDAESYAACHGRSCEWRTQQVVLLDGAYDTISSCK